MASWKHAHLCLAALFALGACRQSVPGNDAPAVTPSNAELAARIDRKLLARHPDLRLERYARFYAGGARGSVRAVYVFANVGYEPIVGRVGESVWTTLDALPVISDGGCTVLTIDYDAPADEIRSVACNGPGGE